MESGSQASEPAERTSSQGLANIIGAVIAILTLIVPIFAIANFSSASYDQLLQSPTRLLPGARDTQD
ncbi:MAG: hypothetical protein Kow00121_25680 [Elainellaceae cyanobacterium]